MKSAWGQLLFAVACLALAGNVAPGATIVAGSDLTPPLDFNPPLGYYPLAPAIDRAFPFTTIADGPYAVTELQVATYRVPNQGGNVANFSIRSDNGGTPGTTLATFAPVSVPTATAVQSTAPTPPLVLSPGVTYWIVGESFQGQARWALSPTASLGPTSFFLNSGPWTVTPSAQLAAYTLLGHRVPEPTTFILVLIAVAAGWGRGRANQSTGMVEFAF